MMPENEEEPILVEVYAQQFNWTVRYSGGDNELGYATVHEIAGANILGVDNQDQASADDIVAKESYTCLLESQYNLYSVLKTLYTQHISLTSARK